MSESADANAIAGAMPAPAARARTGALRILHVITTIERGGAEHHLLALAAAQRQAGHDVTVAYLKGAGELRPAFEQAGVVIESLPWQGLSGTLNAAWRLRRLVARLEPQVVHAHMPPAELVVCIAGLGHRLPPVITSRHNDEPFWRAAGVAGRLIGRFVSARAVAMIAISDAVARHARAERLQPAHGPVTIVRYGIDPTPFRQVSQERIAQLRDEFAVPAGAVMLGFVGRLTEQKGVDVLLDAFAALLSRAGRPVHLVMVGAGPDESEYRARSHRLGIEAHVTWAGRRADVPEVMASFDTFVLPSRWEGFGLVLLEAMAAGVAIVATDVSAIAETVEHQVSGILVAPNDAELLAAALLRVIDPSERERLSLNATHRLEQYTVAAMQQRTESVYDAVLSGGRVR